MKKLLREITSNTTTAPVWSVCLLFFSISLFMYFYQLSIYNLKYIIFLIPIANYIGGAWGHDSAHGSTYKNKKINKILSFLFLDILMGVSNSHWKIKHIKHHNKPNNFKYDPDVDIYPFIRINSDEKVLWFHKFQQYYIYLLYGFILPRYFITDFIKINFEIIIGKILFLISFLIIPIYLTSINQGIIYFLTYSISLSFIFALLAFLNHIQFDNFNYQNEKHWFKKQVESTINYSKGWWKYFIFYISGGLCYQIEHHLFPGVNCHRYFKISKKIKYICNQKNYNYRDITIFTAIKNNFKFLKTMGMKTETNLNYKQWSEN